MSVALMIPLRSPFVSERRANVVQQCPIGKIFYDFLSQKTHALATSWRLRLATAFKGPTRT
jgi:hypothetical protein